MYFKDSVVHGSPLSTQEAEVELPHWKPVWATEKDPVSKFIQCIINLLGPSL